ncbi:hypothetical protein HYW53_00260 [Candidatus Giovannonibacteria bacterium]|nr:hypothetical protein [Candidatus Giovannonibacteria bacterium]
MEKSKLKVGVIFGGLSEEREVSLASGRQAYQLMDRVFFEPVAIYFSREAKFWKIPEALVIRNTCKEIEENLEAKAAIPISYEGLAKEIEFALLTTHGKYGDDGCIQGLLELLGIPYSGSGVLSAALGMDKPMQRKLLKFSPDNINIPEGEVIYKEDWERSKSEIASSLEKKFGFPLVTKPSREGSTLGVKLVKAKGDFDPAMAEAFRFDPSALIEKYLMGREFSCVVMGNKEPAAFLPTETIHNDEIFTYDHKYLPGGSEKVTPMEIDESVIKEIQRQAIAAYKALEAKTFARIDGFVLDSGEVLITDPNSGASTGLGPSSWTFHQASLAGLGPKDFITKLIELGMEAHQGKKGPL